MKYPVQWNRTLWKKRNGFKSHFLGNLFKLLCKERKWMRAIYVLYQSEDRKGITNGCSNCSVWLVKITKKGERMKRVTGKSFVQDFFLFLLFSSSSHFFCFFALISHLESVRIDSITIFIPRKNVFLRACFFRATSSSSSYSFLVASKVCLYILSSITSLLNPRNS